MFHQIIEVSWGQCWLSHYVCFYILCPGQIMWDCSCAEERQLPVGCQAYTALTICIRACWYRSAPRDTTFLCVANCECRDSDWQRAQHTNVSFLQRRAHWNAIESASNNSKNWGWHIVCLKPFLDKHTNPDPTLPHNAGTYHHPRTHSYWLVPQPLSLHIKQFQQLSHRGHIMLHTGSQASASRFTAH